MSRPTIDYPWVKHEQKSKEKTLSLVTPKPHSKEKARTYNRNNKEIITVFEDAFGTDFRIFLVNDFCVHSQTGPAPCPWVMTCDRWCEPRVGYIRTDREQGPASLFYEKNSTLKDFWEKFNVRKTASVCLVSFGWYVPCRYVFV